jgi:hypothetical protein
MVEVAENVADTRRAAGFIKRLRCRQARTRSKAILSGPYLACDLFELTGLVLRTSCLSEGSSIHRSASISVLLSPHLAANLAPYVFRNVTISVLPCFLLISPSLSPVALIGLGFDGITHHRLDGIDSLDDVIRDILGGIRRASFGHASVLR